MKLNMLSLGLGGLAAVIAYLKGMEDGKTRYLELVGIGSKVYMTRDEIKQISDIYEKALQRITESKI